MKHIIKRILVEHQIELHFPPDEELQKYIRQLLQQFEVSDFDSTIPSSVDDLYGEVVDYLRSNEDGFQVTDQLKSLEIARFFIKEHYPYGMNLEVFLGELYRPHDDSMKDLLYSLLGENDASQCYETSKTIADVANDMAYIDYYQEPYDEDDEDAEGEWISCHVRSSCYGVYINDPNDRGCVLEDNITSQFFEYLDEEVESWFREYCNTDIYQVSLGLVNDLGWSLAKAKNVKPYQQLIKFREEFKYFLKNKLDDRIREYARKYLEYVEGNSSFEINWKGE